MKAPVSSLRESLSAVADFEQRTSEAFARHPSSQALDPVDILLRFFHGHRVALLQDFVYRYKSLEGLHFIRHHRLPVRCFCQAPSFALEDRTYTFIPAQKDVDDLWSQV
jgi:hypothetical protein